MSPADLPASFTLHQKDITGSTNDDAKVLAQEGATDFTMVWALEQTAGRGRFNRPWLSDPGNLYCSTVFRLHSDWPHFDTLSLIVALATAQAVSRFLPADKAPQVKWVNDVLVDGAKISGSLNEGSDDTGWVVIGVGINVLLRPPIENPNYEATALADHLSSPPETSEVLSALADELHSLLPKWRKHGLSSEIRADYHALMWRLNEEITVSFDAERQEGVTGINRGITEDGHLKLELENESIRIIAAGDVYGPR